MLMNYFLAVLVLALSLVGTVFMSGGALPVYLDIPSILIMVIFPFVYQCLLFGVPAVKLAFTAGLKKDADIKQVTKAQLFFKSYNKVICFSAFVTVLIGVVAMLANMDDKTKLGANLALVLLSLLYGGLLHIAIIIPNSIFLKKRLIELDTDI